MKGPRKLTEADVRTIMMDMLDKVPPEVTPEEAMPMFIQTIAGISDRVAMADLSNLIGMAAVISKQAIAEQVRLLQRTGSGSVQ